MEDEDEEDRRIGYSSSWMIGSKFCILGTRPDEYDDYGGAGEVYDDDTGGGDENDGEETHLKYLVWCS